ncbi:hypothetical protein D3C81_682260 [compost metagenome]
MTVGNLNARHFSLLAFQELGATSTNDGAFTQHLTNDNFDVFIVNLNALQTVNFLHFVGDVAGNRMHTTQTQNVVRRFWAVRNNVTALHNFAFKHVELTPFWNHLFVSVAAVQWRDYQATFAFGLFTERDNPADLSQDCRLFRTTSFEQVRNAWQTTGNILGTAGFLRNTRQGITRTDLNAVFQLHNRFTWQEVLSRHISTWDQHVVAFGINDFQCRTQVFTATGTLCAVQYNQRRQTGQFVGLACNGLAVNHISEADETTHFGDNWHGVRIPVSNGFAAVNFCTVTFAHHCTIRHFVAFFGTAEFVDQLQFGVTRGNHQLACGVHDELHIAQLQATLVFHLDAGFSSRTRCRTTDVERTHRQLCTRLTD